MGREIKRVRLDFDWPIKTIWPGYMIHLCMDQIQYCIGKEKSHDEACDACRRVAKLSGVKILSYNCPNFRFDPLEGPGWQMWETVTEGSPISPVFATPEELGRWLADNHASAFGNIEATYENWLAMIMKSGWSPSAVIYQGQKNVIESGVQYMAEMEKEDPCLNLGQKTNPAGE